MGWFLGGFWGSRDSIFGGIFLGGFRAPNSPGFFWGPPQADPGSPLACEERGLWFLLGAATPGDPKNPPKSPKFTALDPHERWIFGVAREVFFAETPPDPRDEEREELEGDPEGLPDPEIGGDPEFWGVWGGPGSSNGSENSGDSGISGTPGTWRDPEFWGSPENSETPENLGTPEPSRDPNILGTPENLGTSPPTEPPETSRDPEILGSPENWGDPEAWDDPEPPRDSENLGASLENLGVPGRA